MIIGPLVRKNYRWSFFLLNRMKIKLNIQIEFNIIYKYYLIIKKSDIEVYDVRLCKSSINKV